MYGFPKTLRFWTAALLVLCMSVMEVGPAAAGLAPSRVSGTTTIVTTRDADRVVATTLTPEALVVRRRLP